MSIRRTLAIARRIANGFRRDHRTIGLMFVAPIVILGLLGWVLRDQTPPPTRLAIVNLAGAPGDAIRDRAALGAEAAGIQVDRSITDEAAARTALADDRLDVAVVLPASLPEDLGAGRSPTITVLTPGISPTADSAHLADLQTALRAVASGQAALPTLEHVALFGPSDADFLDAFAPALLGFFAFFLVFVLTGISFLRERVGGTLERLLATPVRRSEIVAGYGAGFGFFAALQVVVILLFALGSLDAPAIGPLGSFSVGLGIANAGSPLLVFVVTLLLALVAVNLGIFISTFARTEFQILQFIPIVVVPQTLLGGVFWPVNSLPDPLEPLARALPLTYAVDGMREVLVKGAGLEASAVQLDVGVLAAFAVLLVVLATVTIRREVA